jgi:integrase
MTSEPTDTNDTNDRQPVRRNRTRAPNGKGRLTLAKGGLWHFRYSDHNGNRRRVSTHTTQRAAAERIAAGIMADVALRKSGIIDPVQEGLSKQARRPLSEHLADFRLHMEAGAATPAHVGTTLRMIGDIIAANRWERIGHITADGINAYGKILKGRGRSQRTIAAHATAIKTFTHWLVNGSKLASDPLLSVVKPNPATDRRRIRRAMTIEEWHALREALTSPALTDTGESHAPDYRDATASERALIYETALMTGYRAGELARLKVSDLLATAIPPALALPASETKNRKAARQSITPDLALRLADHASGKHPAAHLFTRALARSCDMLWTDLEHARSRWLAEVVSDPDEYRDREQSDFLRATDRAGRVLDFHGLRHTAATWSMKATRNLTITQRLMRHSTPVLTANTYGHLSEGEVADAAQAVATMIGTTATPANGRAVATGTHGLDGYSDTAGAIANFVTIGAASEGHSVARVCTDLNNNQELATAGSVSFSGLSNEKGPISGASSQLGGAGIEPATHGFSVHCSTS